MKSFVVSGCVSVVVAALLATITPGAVDAKALASPCCLGLAALAGGAIIGAATHNNRRHHSCGCHSCCGRKKRGISEAANTTLIEELYTQVSFLDEDQCGLRLICELAQKDDHQLTGNEKLVMLPYSGEGVHDGSKFGLYDEAVWHGQEGRECHALFPLCAFSAPNIMEQIDQLNTL